MDVFSRSSRGEDDEEALKWASVERLPSFLRIRRSLFVEDKGQAREIDVKNLGFLERKIILDRLLKNPEKDNEKFLLKLKERLDRVGLETPTIEVRFQNLNVVAEIYVGGRALPTILNFVANIFEEIINYLHIFPSRKSPLRVLHDVSGIIKPQRMTLLLGPPSSGKTTLLLANQFANQFLYLSSIDKSILYIIMTLLLGPPSSGKTTLLLALAGKLAKDLKFSGKITYNGHEMHEFVPQKTSAYISQRDLHIGEMTVRETLAFSARCQGVGTFCEMLAELLRREKELKIKPDPDIDVYMKAAALEGQKTSVVTDYILKIMGLEACADTMVGDELVRGISGGEKKRVTTGEMLVGPARALFMDEISTGLDSSTTFQIVNSIRQSIHIMKGTTLISLLQPAPETYELFDDIILLSDGKIVYQGPRENVLEFFEWMGFKCPERKGVADFLQEVTSKKDQEQYCVKKDEPHRFVTVNEFVEAFQSFHIGQKLGDELKTPYDKSRSHPAALTTKKYCANKDLLKACLSRELLLMKRNSFAYIFKSVLLIFMAFVTMTIFLRTTLHRRTATDGGIYLGAIFFGVVSAMFNGISELGMTVMKLPIFYKQRDLLFYPSWAYSLATWIPKIPINIIEGAIWVFMTYYVIGFDPSVERLFKQFFLLFCVKEMASALFRMLAGLGRDIVVAGTIGSFSLLIVMVLGGFVLSRVDIPKWWIWGYWISPMMYAQNAISVNEFRGKSWSHVPQNSTEPLGVTVLKSRGLFPEAYWYWIGVGATIGYIFLFNFLFTLALNHLDPIGKPQAVLSKESLAERNANKTEELNELSSTTTNWVDSNGKGQSSRSVRSLSSRLSRVDDGNQNQRRGMVLPFQPLSLCFDEIRYAIDMPQEMRYQGINEDRLELLKGVNGAFRPGVLTALMGVTGAGKTTLMDVLAGRKTGGYIEGTIMISGHPKKQETFARISGYCEQTDIHSPYVTVYESLVYSAWLRLPPQVDYATRKMFIEEVMDLVELTLLREALVGLPGVTGLSTEQRKRLTIAVELVANPSIIFMDEPTSGLDARAAAIVMRTVRNTVDTGRTVVCTIHQPSIDVFDAFDELLLLKLGGEQIYAGPLGLHCSELIKYFEAINGVPKIRDGYNPATWMLEITSAAHEATLGVHFVDVYKNSELFKRNKALIEELSKPPPGSDDLFFPTQYSQPFFIQCMACLWKQHLLYWRNTSYTAIRLLLTIVIALLFGMIFWNLGSKRRKTQGLFNAMGAMYSAVGFIGTQNGITIQPVVAIERAVFYRERAAGMYSAFPYAFAQLVIEFPYTFVQTVIYGFIVYSMMGFEWIFYKFFWFLFVMFCTFLYYTYYGMMTMAISPNHHVASILSSTFYAIWNLFSGFVIPISRIPIWWKWFYWICPMAWTLYGLIASQFGDVKDKLETGETVEHFVRNYFGFRHDFLGVVAVVTVGFPLLFAIIFAFSIKAFNFQIR